MRARKFWQLPYIQVQALKLLLIDKKSVKFIE